jgi:hypothetical protein
VAATTAFSIRSEADTCAIEYLRADDVCEEVQLWRSTLAAPFAPIEFVSVTSCEPAGCSFEGTPLLSCSIGPIGVFADLPVTDLGPDRLRLGPFPGPPGVPCGTLSFDVARTG